MSETPDLLPFEHDAYQVRSPQVLLIAPLEEGRKQAARVVELFDVSRWVVFCNKTDEKSEVNTEAYDFWAEKLGSGLAVHDGLKNLESVMQFQKKKSHLYRSEKQLFPQKYKLGLIFEGLSRGKSDLIEDLMCNARFYHIIPIILTSYPRSLSPAVRCNVDYLFCGSRSMSKLGIIYDSLLGEPNTLKEFLQLTNQAETKNSWLVLDNTVRGGNAFSLWSLDGHRPV